MAVIASLFGRADASLATAAALVTFVTFVTSSLDAITLKVTISPFLMLCRALCNLHKCENMPFFHGQGRRQCDMYNIMNRLGLASLVSVFPCFGRLSLEECGDYANEQMIFPKKFFQID